MTKISAYIQSLTSSQGDSPDKKRAEEFQPHGWCWVSKPPLKWGRAGNNNRPGANVQ